MITSNIQTGLIIAETEADRDAAIEIFKEGQMVYCKGTDKLYILIGGIFKLAAQCT